jgi:hypothetical protein
MMTMGEHENEPIHGWCHKCDAPHIFLPFLNGKGHFCNACGQRMGKKLVEETVVCGVDVYQGYDGRTHRTIVLGHVVKGGNFVMEKEIHSVWRS